MIEKIENWQGLILVLAIEKSGIIQSISEKATTDLTNSFEENNKSKLVWSSSGAIVIERKSLINFIPEKGVALSPSLINYVANKNDLHLEKCAGTRISIDNEKSYLAAVEISAKSQKLFNRTF